MAGRASLTFLGQEDIILSGDPEVTYFLSRYASQTPYATKTDKVQFTSQVRFGDEATLVIPKSGDLITGIAIKLNFPKTPASVLDSVGTLMIEMVELFCDGQLIERIYGQYIDIIEDVKIPQGKQAGLFKLVGKLKTVTTLPYAKPSSAYTIKLPFSCLRNGLPLCALENSEITFRVILKDSLDITYPPTLIYEPIDMFLHVEYTYLSEAECGHLKSKPFIYLTEEANMYEYNVKQGDNYIRIKTELTNPVKELFFVIQNTAALGYDYTTDGTNEQLQDVTLYINGVDRIPKLVGSALFLRVIQANEFHTRLPDRLFYMYSFSLDPEDHAPSGSINMSRIQNQIFDFNLNSSLESRTIKIYSLSYNFFEVRDGKGHILFPNM